MSYHVSKTWLAFVSLKIIYIFVALIIYTRFSSLGDTFDYLGGSYFRPSQMFVHSTFMIGTVAHYISSSFGMVPTHLFFCFLSIVGIRYALMSMNLTLGQLRFALLILSFPTFAIWTSITSKEAVSVFYMGLIYGNIYNYAVYGSIKNLSTLLIGLYLCFLFKPLYLIPIFSIGIFLLLGKFLRARSNNWCFLIFLFVVVSFALVYFSIDKLNDLIEYLPRHFSSDAGSTRENAFWLEDYDIIKSAPYGIYLALTGPTLLEAIEKPGHFLALMESYVLLAIFGHLLLLIVVRDLKKFKVNLFYIGFLMTALIWILLVNYPFGVLNPGSALRYRSNYYLFSFLIIFAVFKRFELKNQF